MANNEDMQQDVTLAVLKNDVDYIKKSLAGITEKLDILERNYIRRDEVETMKVDLAKADATINEGVRGIELDIAVFKTQVKTWGAAAMILLGILQFIISTFIK